MAFRVKETMANKYNLHKDLIDRLDRTICRYDGKPVGVTIESAHSIQLWNVMKGWGQDCLGVIRPDDPKFDISSPELGYCNIYDKKDHIVSAVYSMRVPYRRYKQGLCDSAIRWSDIKGSEDTYINGVGKFSQNRGFIESLSGVFPSLDDVLRDFHGSSVAINQEVALQKIDSGMLLVYFKCRNVGWISPGNKKITIPNSGFEWIITRYLKNMEFEVR